MTLYGGGGEFVRGSLSGKLGGRTVEVDVDEGCDENEGLVAGFGGGTLAGLLAAVRSEFLSGNAGGGPLAGGIAGEF